jgi:hypothetical protein
MLVKLKHKRGWIIANAVWFILLINAHFFLLNSAAGSGWKLVVFLGIAVIQVVLAVASLVAMDRAK